MFEARLISGKIFRQIVDSIKDLVTDGNIDCTPEEISIQCMDSSHVSLVAVSLSQSAFDHYRCDRTLSLGFNSNNMSKILKMMGRDDILILKAEDDGDVMTMMFENPKTETIADFGTLHREICECDPDEIAVTTVVYFDEFTVRSYNFVHELTIPNDLYVDSFHNKNRIETDGN